MLFFYFIMLLITFYLKRYNFNVGFMRVYYYTHIADNISQVADNTWNQDSCRPRAISWGNLKSPISAIVSDNKVYVFLNRRNNLHNGNATKCSSMRCCKASTYISWIACQCHYFIIGLPSLSVDLLYVP